MYLKELLQFLAIKDGNGNKVMDFKKKVKALKRVLFLSSPLTDLADVEGADYLEPIVMDNEIILKEIRDIIWHLAVDKALGILGILNRFLKAICIKIIKIFKRIFQACLNYRYYLKKVLKSKYSDIEEIKKG